MKIKHREINDILIIELIGSLDINFEINLYEYVLERLNETDKYLAFDLNRLDFIDSTGIGILVKCVRACESRKKKFIIYSMKKKIEEVFEAASLLNFFNIISSAEFEKKYLNRIKIKDIDLEE